MQEIQQKIKTGDIKSTSQVALCKIPKFQTCYENKAARDHTNGTRDQSQNNINIQAQAPQLTTPRPQICQDTHGNIEDNPP
jgi:hypothetical protein